MRTQSKPRQPKSYADVARAVSSWTTRGILTALVLVAGLGFGRQVLRWWRQGGEPPSAAPSVEGPSAAASGSGPDHVLRFGEQPWSLRTTRVAGDRDAAATALRTACRGMVSQSRLPDEPPDETERALLGRLAAAEPCERGPDGWELFELPRGVPMAVATLPAREKGTGPICAKHPPGRSGKSGLSPFRPGEGENLAGARRRVVTWGLAVPRAAREWSIYTFQPDRPGGSTAGGLPEVPLPPDALRTLAVETAGSGTIVAFEGPGPPGAWKRFYDDWLAGGRFRPVAAWHHSPESWHLRCRGEGEHAEFSLDVHVFAGTPGGTSGLIVITFGAEGAPQGN